MGLANRVVNFFNTIIVREISLNFKTSGIKTTLIKKIKTAHS